MFRPFGVAFHLQREVDVRFNSFMHAGSPSRLSSFSILSSAAFGERTRIEEEKERRKHIHTKNTEPPEKAKRS